MSAMVYTVVEFRSKSAATVEIVPIRWLNAEEDIYKWPRCGSAEASRKVKKLVEADATWSEFPIRVLGKAGWLLPCIVFMTFVGWFIEVLFVA
jgi:hypothetical protein